MSAPRFTGGRSAVKEWLGLSRDELQARLLGDKSRRPELPTGFVWLKVYELLERARATGDAENAARLEDWIACVNSATRGRSHLQLSTVRGSSFTPKQSTGWHIESSGATGRPIGRPPGGVTDPEEITVIVNRFDRVFDVSAYRQAVTKRGPARGRQDELLDFARLIRHCRDRNVNMAALAEHYGIHRRRVYALLKSTEIPEHSLRTRLRARPVTHRRKRPG